MKYMTLMVLVMIIGLVVAGAWDSIPAVKTSVHAALDPSLGSLMNWNMNLGFVIIVVILTLITTLLQKYFTDQETLKTIKEEQKIIQEEMKTLKSNPDKQMELSRKSMELQMKAMPLTMKPIIYTTIPFILSFRWFSDYFSLIDAKLLYFFTPSHVALLPQWVWAYMIVTLVCSPVLRKWMKVH